MSATLATPEVPFFEPMTVLRAPDAAQVAAAQSKKGPGTVVDDTSFGSKAWSNESNAKSSDNAYATAALKAAEVSHFLKATNFGFGLPENAAVTAIYVSVERKASALSMIYDSQVRLCLNGEVLVGGSAHDKASNQPWPTSDTTRIYGDPNPLWGLKWTPTQINSTGFGAAINTENLGASEATASIDAISITVYYTEGPDENRVCFATRSIELRSDDIVRQHPSEDIWGRVVPEGFLPYAPPSGLEKRAIRGVITPSQGDLDELSDGGANKLSCVVKYRPAYLFAREAADE